MRGEGGEEKEELGERVVLGKRGGDKRGYKRGRQKGIRGGREGGVLGEERERGRRLFST